MEMDHPELPVLADGRTVAIESIAITRSLAGIYVGAPEVIWRNVVGQSPYSMGRGRDGLPPAYVIPPESTVPGQLCLPEWKIVVELQSEGLDETVDQETDAAHAARDRKEIIELVERSFNNVFSSVVLVFFCDDLSDRPVTDLIGSQAAQMDEEVWAQHACGSLGEKAHRTTRPEQD